MIENHWRSPVLLTYIRDILVELEDLALKAEEVELSQLCRSAAKAAGDSLSAYEDPPRQANQEDGAAA